MRYCLAGTVLVMGICWAMANTAFALGDTCSNVDITLTNATAVKIKVTKFEYYDYSDKKWRTEVMFGVDGHEKLEQGKSWSTTQDLEHIENDSTKFKVTYEADIDGTTSGNPVSTTTSDFTCKDNMKKVVLLNVAPPSGGEANALGDTCSNVGITLTNSTAAKIKVTKFEYYDYSDKKWRTEVMFGVDGHQKLERGASWSKTQDLEHIENDNTKFKVTYEADIDGTTSGNPVSTTTGDFTCKDNMKKGVILDYLPQRRASLIFFYFGDSPYTSLGQETLKLKKAMEGYDYKVLLKHETLPGWADLSEKDEKLANIKEVPTKANLFKYIIQLAKDGYSVDLFIFSHGWSGKFKASTGTHGSTDFVTTDDIKNELRADKTGFTEMPIRIVWGPYCFGQTLDESWRSVGAKATAGARFVNFYPNTYGRFIDDWNKGNVSFERAVVDSDTNSVRTVAQTYISLGDAPAKKKAGKWGGCPPGKFVLGDDPCAKDYFVSVWLAKDEWQEGKSGKENMNHSSYMFLGGDKNITKNTQPVWKP